MGRIGEIKEVNLEGEVAKVQIIDRGTRPNTDCVEVISGNRKHEIIDNIRFGGRQLVIENGSHLNRILREYGL